MEAGPKEGKSNVQKSSKMEKMRETFSSGNVINKIT